MSSTLDNLDLVGTDSTVFILCSDISHYFTNNWKSNKVISSRAIFPLFLFYKKWQPNWSFFFLHLLFILFLFLLSHILTFSFSLSPLHLFFTSYPLSLSISLSLSSPTLFLFVPSLSLSLTHFHSHIVFGIKMDGSSCLSFLAAKILFYR